MASSSSDALLSQDLFDETVLENEECFDLSPDDALHETIDQFCQQLGASSSSSSSSFAPSPTSVANSSTSTTNTATTTPLSEAALEFPPPPAILSHLILSHPNSSEGKRDRINRNQFQNSLTLLDECVNTDGTVKNVENDHADGNDGEKVLQALVDIGRRCRVGDIVNSESAGKNDDNSETKNDHDKTKNNNYGNPFPYLAIFQRTSSIYTLMSFLSIFNPAQCSSAAAETNPMRLQILRATAQTLSSILSNNNNNTTARDHEKCVALRAELRDSFIPALGRLVCLIGGIAKIINKHAMDGVGAGVESTSLVQTSIDLLQLGINATRGCESAKVAFVQSVLSSEFSTVNNNNGSNVTKRGGVAVILSCLSLHGNNSTTNNSLNNTTLLLTDACQLIASLCRYDDFRDPSSSTSGAMGATGVSTSSAHDHAMEFHRAGAAPLLIEIARHVLSESTPSDEGDLKSDMSSGVVANERLAAAVLTALRVLAVNDEIIQTMVALGVLPIVTRALQFGVSTAVESEDGGGAGTSGAGRARKQRLVAASLGLLRNLCGNDEIKTNLCLGSSSSSSPSILPHLLRSMQLHPSTALIQEHGCGTLAAMALRRPGNARAILDADGPRWVIVAMRRHESNVNVQRQGALAVRNVVSRLLRDLPEDESGVAGTAAGAASVENERSSVRDDFLELGAEAVLRNIAGQHQGSVDEAYAALRDLGCTVSLVKFNADDLQKSQSSGSGVRGVGRTMMFGEKHNSNFRPVYEESAGLSDNFGN